MQRWLPGLWIAVLALPTVAAHGAEDGAEDQLDDGLMVGGFDAAQPGPLVIVPYADAPLPCDLQGEDVARVPLGPDATLALLGNATHVAVTFDLPGDGVGFSAVAVDTHEASRALILMQENAIALHRLDAVVRRPGPNGTTQEHRPGVLGLPYELDAGGMHGFTHDLEGAGILIGYEDAYAGTAPCDPDAAVHVGLAFARQDMPGSLAAGTVVHVVALYDPEVPFFLPRPVDASTHILQLNLYLARPGEEPDDVRSAFDGRARGADGLALLGLGLGVAFVARRR